MTWMPATLHKARPLVKSVPRHCGSDFGFELTAGDEDTFVRVGVSVDLEEHGNRLANGVGALRNEYHLATLLSLPAGQLSPVRPFHQDAIEALLDQSLVSVVEDPDGGLWGRARVSVPLEVTSIDVYAKTLRRALSIAHAWTGFGQRTVVFPASSRPHPLLLSEASMYGIGARSGQDGRWLLSPAPYQPDCWTTARWKLAESLYAELLLAAVLKR